MTVADFLLFTKSTSVVISTANSLSVKPHLNINVGFGQFAGTGYNQKHLRGSVPLI